MPTTAQVTYSAQRLLPAKLVPPAGEDVRAFAASLTVTRGTVLGEVTATGKLALYNSGASDGTQTATCIAMYDFLTDASGNVIYTTTAGQAVGDLNQTYKTAPVYISGVFKTSELNIGGVTGITSTALGHIGGHLYSGSLTDGLIIF